MINIDELKEKLNTVATEMKAMNQLCIDEDRDFSEEEEGRYAELEKELDLIQNTVEADEKATQERAERAARLKERQDRLNVDSHVDFPNNPRINLVEPEDFKSLNDFLGAAMAKVLFHKADNRLLRYYTISMNNPEFRAEQSMGEGTAGGYMVPTQFRPEMMEIAVQQAIVRPRATVIPAGDPPDAEITLPALDQSSSVTGGVDLSWAGEGDTKGQTTFALKQVSLIPHELSGYIDVTDKLIANWPACVSFVERMLKLALMSGEDYTFINGNGVGKPKGIVNQNCAISVTRNTASSILYADIRKMYWQVLRRAGATPVWVISPSALESLLALADPGSAGTMIFQPNAREGLPFTLMGHPLIVNERSPALGSTGDLMLLNLSYYLIKDGSGPYVAASPHVHFTSNKTCIKIFYNVDGDSWLQDKFPLEGDTSNYLSPFVILE